MELSGMVSEPRLLTLDEVQNLKCGQWVWVETENGIDHFELADDACTNDDPYRYTELICESGQGCVRFNTAQGGWRAWTGKPAVETIRATKWKAMGQLGGQALIADEEVVC